MKRKNPEIPSASLADIAFMLLIFFLVTTTMDMDIGISKKLPPFLDTPPDSTKVKERNIMTVLVNKYDLLMVDKDYMKIDHLKNKVKRFIANSNNDEKLPEQINLILLKKNALKSNDLLFAESIDHAINIVGEDVKRSKGVISLQNDRNTSYWKYIEVQNELAKAFNELRDEFSLNKFGQKFDDLTQAQKEAVKILIPQSISEAEPKKSK